MAFFFCDVAWRSFDEQRWRSSASGFNFVYGGKGSVRNLKSNIACPITRSGGRIFAVNTINPPSSWYSSFHWNPAVWVKQNCNKLPTAAKISSIPLAPFRKHEVSTLTPLNDEIRPDWSDLGRRRDDGIAAVLRTPERGRRWKPRRFCSELYCLLARMLQIRQRGHGQRDVVHLSGGHTMSAAKVVLQRLGWGSGAQMVVNQGLDIKRELRGGTSTVALVSGGASNRWCWRHQMNPFLFLSL